jgi:hypothetical protein
MKKGSIIMVVEGAGSFLRFMVFWFAFLFPNSVVGVRIPNPAPTLVSPAPRPAPEA